MFSNFSLKFDHFFSPRAIVILDLVGLFWWIDFCDILQDGRGRGLDIDVAAAFVHIT